MISPNRPMANVMKHLHVCRASDRSVREIRGHRRGPRKPPGDARHSIRSPAGRHPASTSRANTDRFMSNFLQQHGEEVEGDCPEDQLVPPEVRKPFSDLG